MIKNLLILLTACLLSATLSDPCYAFRCGNEIVTRGDSSAEIINKCGEPERKEYSYENINGEKIPVDNWYYNCGEQNFIHVLSIYNNKIIKEDTSKRGSGQNKCR